MKAYQRRIIFSFVAVILGMLLTGILFAAEQASQPAASSSKDIDDMMAEVGKLSAEKGQIESKLVESLRLKRMHEAEWKVLDEERLRRNAEVEQHNGSCGGKDWSKPGFSQCQGSYNRLESWLNNLKTKRAAWQSKENARVNVAKQMVERRNTINKRLQFLKGTLLNLAAFNKANTECKGSDEAIHQCMQSIWDGARSSYESDPMVVKPQPFKATPRTQEQAIEEYKKSGEAPGPKTLKINEPPPPSTK
jgi:hypothetical protein